MVDVRSWPETKLAGQRLMAGFEGTRLNREIAGLITNLQIGALILFRRNVESPAQLAALCRDVQACARDHDLPPLIIAIDQEGGQVARLGPPFTQFPGNPAIRDSGDAEHFAAITAAELESAGINMNLAPVLDVAAESFPSIVAGRVFGTDPKRVADLGAVVIKGLQDRRIMSVAKHFPGIGRTTLDSHLDLPVFEADLAALESFEFVPFQAAIQNRVAGIMLSHILYPRLDSRWPASLSKTIARNILRRQLGFGGVVMTDDLEMGAITRHYGFRTAIRQVLRADIDLALICHSGEKIANAHALLARKIDESQTMRARAEASTARVMALKTHYLAAEPLQEIRSF